LKLSKLDSLIQKFTWFGNLFPQFLICCLLLAINFKQGFIVGALWFWGYAINLLIKNTVRRQRPPKEHWRLNHVNGLSFPSGHSLTSFVLYWSIAKYFAVPFPWSLVFYAMPFFLGLTRLYFRVHYLSDVLAGWLIAYLYLTFAGDFIIDQATKLYNLFFVNGFR
jgi:undecaprenyl-diphosphatase